MLSFVFVPCFLKDLNMRRFQKLFRNLDVATVSGQAYTPHECDNLDITFNIKAFNVEEGKIVQELECLETDEH